MFFRRIKSRISPVFFSTSLCDWLRSYASSSYPIRCKTNTNSSLVTTQRSNVYECANVIEARFQAPRAVDIKFLARVINNYTYYRVVSYVSFRNFARELNRGWPKLVSLCMLYLRPLVTDISSCLIPSTCNSLRSYLPLVIVCIFFGQRLCFFKLVSVLDTQTYRALRK